MTAPTISSASDQKKKTLIIRIVESSGRSESNSAENIQPTDLSSTIPKVTAYNFAHFVPGGNAADWWRYSRVSGARMFLNPNHFQVTETTRPGESDVGTREGFVIGEEAPATLILIRGPRLPMDFDSWIERAFPNETDPEIVGPLSSAAGNGLPNLLTFAIGLDPAAPSLENLPRLERSEAGQARFHFQRNKLAAGVALKVEVSHDLLHWSAENLTVSTISEDEAIAAHVATVDAVTALNRLFSGSEPASLPDQERQRR